MKKSRDIALIIMFTVLNFSFAVLIGQVPGLITGIPGIAYAFIIVHSINQSVSWPMFEGRRWRVFTKGLLFSLLCLFFIPAWVPPVAMAAILNVTIVDLIFMSLYGFFKRENKLFWWILLTQVYFHTAQPLWIIPFSALFIPIEKIIANWVVPVVSVMLPVIIIEAIAGSYIGYKIYRRVEKIT